MSAKYSQTKNINKTVPKGITICCLLFDPVYSEYIRKDPFVFIPFVHWKCGATIEMSGVLHQMWVNAAVEAKQSALRCTLNIEPHNNKKMHQMHQDF